MATVVAAAYWNSVVAAGLVAVWLPLTYSLSAAVSGRRRLVDQLSASPLFLAVSRVVPYENPFGWRRQFQFAEAIAERWRNAKADKASYVKLRSGQPYFSDQLFDQQLSFWSGVRENILELSENAVYELKEWCRRYREARVNFDLCFIGVWIVVVPVSIAGNVSTDIALMMVAASLAAFIGSRSGVSIGDKTKDEIFLRRWHCHVYSYYPGDQKVDAHYYCLCGAVHEAVDDADDASPER